MLWTGVEVRDLICVSLFLDLVFVQERHQAGGVVEDRRPFATVCEVDRQLFIDG